MRATQARAMRPYIFFYDLCTTMLENFCGLRKFSGYHRYASYFIEGIDLTNTLGMDNVCHLERSERSFSTRFFKGEAKSTKLKYRKIIF